MKNLKNLIIFVSTCLLALSASAKDHFPVQIKNCGIDIEIKSEPKRVIIANNDSISLLDEVNALEKVVARGAIPIEGVYEDRVYEIINKSTLLSKKKNDTGGSIITLESILSYQPDLLIASDSSFDRETLRKSGIVLYSPPAFCKDVNQRPTGDATFERIFSELENFGKMFGQSKLAAENITKLKKIIANFKSKDTFDGTAIAVYVGGNGTLYPYGAGSMVTPIFNTVGLKNVYENEKERVFEASIEDILGKNPNTVVLLHASGTQQALLDSFYKVSGTQSLSAVKNERVVVFSFAFTDPPTPHSIYGLPKLVETLSSMRVNVQNK